MKKYLDLIIFLTLLSYYILFSCTTLFGFWLFIAIGSLIITFILALPFFYKELFFIKIEFGKKMDVSIIFLSLLSTCIPAIIFFPVLFSIFDDNRTVFQDFNINWYIFTLLVLMLTTFRSIRYIIRTNKMKQVKVKNIRNQLFKEFGEF